MPRKFATGYYRSIPPYNGGYFGSILAYYGISLYRPYNAGTFFSRTSPLPRLSKEKWLFFNKNILIQQKRESSIS